MNRQEMVERANQEVKRLIKEDKCAIWKDFSDSELNEVCEALVEDYEVQPAGILGDFTDWFKEKACKIACDVAYGICMATCSTKLNPVLCASLCVIVRDKCRKFC